MRFRRFGLFVACMVASGALAGHARAQQALQDWQTALQSIGCKGQYGSEAYYDLDTVIAVAASAATSSIEAFAGRAEIRVVDYLLSGSTMSSARDAEDFTDRMLAANPQALDRFKREIDRYGDALCPLLTMIRTETLQTITRKQVNVRDYYQPQSRLAQGLLNIHGCQAGTADSLFGPGSVEAWNRAAAGGAFAAKQPGDLPSPGDVLALASAKNGPLCMPDLADPKGFDPDLLYRTFAACHAGLPADAWAPIGWQIALLSQRDGAIDPVRLETMLREVLGGCGDQIQFYKDTSGERQAGPDQVYRLLKTVFATLPAWPEETAGIETVATATLDALSLIDGDAEMADDLWQGAVSRLGLDYYNGDGLPRRADVGLYLAAHASREAERGDETPEAFLVRAGAEGALPDTFPPGLQEAIIALLPIDEEGVYSEEDNIAEEEVYAREQADRIYTKPWWTGDAGLISAEQIALGFTLALGDNEAAVSAARQAATDADYASRLREDADAQTNAVIATLLLEGFVDGGKHLPLALAHMRAASDKGSSFATLRLAQMHEQGYGVERNIGTALELYENAAKQGQTAASLALARFYETGEHVARDWDEALIHYRAGLGLDGDGAGLTDGAAGAVQGRLMNGSAFFIEGPGLDLLDSVETRIAAAATDEDSYGASRGTLTAFASSMGDAYAGLQAGPSVDLAEASRWYRIAGDRDANRKLTRILLARPDLAADATELDRVIAGSLYGLYRSAPSLDAFHAAVEEECAAGGADCVEFHRVAALGGYGQELVEYAYDWLSATAEAELAEIRETGRLQPEHDYETKRPAYAVAGWVDVLAYYGDYEGAREALMSISYVPSDEDMLTSRGASIRRALARHLDGGPDEAWKPLERLLRALAQRGDTEARDFLELAALADRPLSGPEADIDTARERFALAEGLEGNNAGLALAARQLSRLESDAGARLRAVELELIALNADMARHNVTAVWDGPIEASLGKVCTLSRASERLYAMDEAGMALTLAKRSVNELQDVRRRISGLPERLQLCFRDTISDHYRWLADLFISQDRPSEAAAVMAMLKSFETFEFVGRDTEFAGDAFEDIVLSEEELALSDEIEALRPTVTAQKIRRRELMLRRKSGDLSDDEAVELESLTEALVASREDLQSQMSELIAASQAVESTAIADIAGSISSIRAHLRRSFGGKAAAIQYVVLPDRIGVVLTTAVSERVFSLRQWKGAAFAEDRLNEAIASLRRALQNSRIDPKPASQDLNALLLPDDLMREVEDAGASTLILSLDRRLRYVPFAALHDGERYLVERFSLTHATETRSLGATGVSADQIAGFGTTQAWHGLSPLPGVADELARVVRSGADDADGVVDGSVYTDMDFNRDTIADAMIFGGFDEPALGIVHFASHFILGPSEDDSYLLLGDGDRLTVADIKDSFAMDLDFAEVGILTLSACETAFSGVDSDGRELESFAAVAQQKGALQVVATLWPINDRSTAVFMQEFYRQQIEEGRSVAEALAEVQRQFLRGQHKGAGYEFRAAKSKQKRDDTMIPDETHPYYWAPIVSMEGTS